jgi:uncharacterized protein (TIGR01777 family)
MNAKVLISGGSGTVGKHLTSLLLSKGYTVSHLSRQQDQFGKVRVHRWDPGKGILDPEVFEGIDYVIHLAGANIGEKRWTPGRKKTIISSRVDSAKLIHKTITDNIIKIRAFISASGISYYGTVTSEKIFTEDDPPADDFLGQTVVAWEDAAKLFENSGIRSVSIRTAMVLEKNDSALTKILAPAKFGMLFQTGSGKQYMPWIHVKDICNIYVKAIEDSSIQGPYNAVSPMQVTHHQFMKTLSGVIKRPLFPVPVPGFLLGIIYGEMAGIILKGSRVSPEKIRAKGFNFQYPDLYLALTDLLT